MGGMLPAISAFLLLALINDRQGYCRPRHGQRHSSADFALAERRLAGRFACHAVVPAGGFGWVRWLGTRGTLVGMKGFGASAKASNLYKHFGITAEAIAAEARRLAK
jgi:transketolase